jgi:serine/threonine protein phosphatase PrpC
MEEQCSQRKAIYKDCFHNAACFQFQDRAEEDRYCYGHGTIKGPDKVKSKRFLFFAVFDGHGNPKNVTSKHVVDYCEKNFGPFLVNELCNHGGQITSPWKICHRLKKICKKFDEKMYDLYAKGELDYGSTCSCVIVIDNVVFHVNLGDSKSILFDSERTILKETMDHKPDVLEEKARILEAGLSVSYGRIDGHYGHAINISRSFGDFHLKLFHNNYNGIEAAMSAIPDVGFLVLEPEKPLYFMVVSDGVTENKDALDLVYSYDFNKSPQENGSSIMFDFGPPRIPPRDDITLLLGVLHYEENNT